MRGLFVLLSVATVCGSISAALAADKDIQVKFAPGTSSGHFENRIKGYDVVRYHLDARAGQTLSVELHGTENSCDFVVQGPDSRTIFDELHTPRMFRHRLEQTGTYRIIAGMMRNSARRGRTCAFSLDLSITD